MSSQFTRKEMNFNHKELRSGKAAPGPHECGENGQRSRTSTTDDGVFRSDRTNVRVNFSGCDRDAGGARGAALSLQLMLSADHHPPRCMRAAFDGAFSLIECFALFSSSSFRSSSKRRQLLHR
ncbi:unnamed protein product [Heligmosomoides polygyrus]|uniref:Uncharacterized protein n=1 Tax=Heligmosomoides polygyrus TaxID=6339 RepID=A0A183G4A3_HELPZ|nr:unnamed protein product [Heligmosomoides polygyrus]